MASQVLSCVHKGIRTVFDICQPYKFRFFGDTWFFRWVMEGPVFDRFPKISAKKKNPGHATIIWTSSCKNMMTDRKWCSTAWKQHIVLAFCIIWWHHIIVGWNFIHKFERSEQRKTSISCPISSLQLGSSEITHIPCKDFFIKVMFKVGRCYFIVKAGLKAKPDFPRKLVLHQIILPTENLNQKTQFTG